MKMLKCKFTDMLFTLQVEIRPKGGNVTVEEGGSITLTCRVRILLKF